MNRTIDPAAALAKRDKAFAEALAPHLDPAWVLSALTEMRLLNIKGTAIGVTLGDLDARCAASGATAHDAFGDPTAYVRHLFPDAREGLNPAEFVEAAGPGILSFFGFVVALGSVGGVRAGQPVAVTWGSVYAVALLFAGMLAFIVCLPGIVRLCTRRPRAVWAIGAGAALVTGGAAACQFLARGVAVDVPAIPWLFAGIAALVVATVLGIRWRQDADPIIMPGGRRATTNPMTGERWLQPWVFNVAAIVGLLVAAFQWPR